MKFKTLIRETGALLHLTLDEALDSSNVFDFQFEDGVILSVHYCEERESLGLTALLGFYPPKISQCELFEVLLRAQIYGLWTGGAYFGVDPEHSKVFMFKTLDAVDFDSERFASKILQFRQVHASWKQAYQDGSLLSMDPSTSTNPLCSELLA